MKNFKEGDLVYFNENGRLRLIGRNELTVCKVVSLEKWRVKLEIVCTVDYRREYLGKIISVKIEEVDKYDYDKCKIKVRKGDVIAHNHNKYKILNFVSVDKPKLAYLKEEYKSYCEKCYLDELLRVDAINISNGIMRRFRNTRLNFEYDILAR